MNITDTRRLGRTTLDVPVFGLGTCPIGDMFEALKEDQASATLEAAWREGIRYFDTAPWYGRGQAEHRVGHFLRRKPRAGAIVSTKVGRRLFRPADRATFRTDPWVGGLAFDHVHDYTRDGILRSYEDSLLRLGLNKVDVLLIHDLDRGHFPDPEELAKHLRDLEGSGFRALEELKAAGEVAAIGAGINEHGMIDRFLDRYPLDVFLVASRYTLLEQEIFPELQRCEREGAGIVLGGVFNSGVLATGPVPDAHYEYARVPPAIATRVRALDAVCRSHDVPLAAAALRFPLAFGSVASIIPGAVQPSEVQENTALFAAKIPDALWSDLRDKGLLRPDVPVPSDSHDDRH